MTTALGIAGVGASLLSSRSGAKAAKSAGKAQSSADLAAVEEQRRQFDVTQESLAPFREAGVGALEQQQALLGLSGAGAQQSAFDQFAESPGQRFLRERGEKALVRNASAIGGLGGGNVRSALQEQGIGFASQQLNEQLRQLGGISGTGQQTAIAQGQIGANTTANIGAGLRSAGAARSSGILGAQQARAAGIEGVLGGLGTIIGGGK